MMIGLISLASSCKKEIDTEDFGSIPIELRLRVLDSNNRETTEIKAGENFWLSFLLINRSKKESEYWQLSNGNNFGDTDFFRVYRIEADNSKVDMGTPLKSLLCQWRPKTPIGYPGDTMEIKIQWQPDSLKSYPFICAVDKTTQTLKVGKYQTGFTERFKFYQADSFKVMDKKVFNLSFDIK